ncbi:MAG: hypothetical protein K9L78_05400 [Victivallales bacterium]|nr:hypothetical protein [Victivallales bacterium]MCF7889537.1 hypothetical protein [Victivallales bacterium]
MKKEQKIAVLDISPDSVSMLLTCSDGLGNLEIINEFGAVTRLVDSINKYNILPKESIKKTIDICEEMVNIVNADNYDKIIAVVTSSLSKVINRSEFLGGCHTRFNIFPHILTPHEENNYIYKGAVQDFLNIKQPIIVIEVGEHTAEIIYGTKEVMIDAFSLNLGSLYLSHIFKLKNTFFNKVRSPLRKFIKKTSEDAVNTINNWLNNRDPLIICTGSCATTYAGLISKDGQYNRASLNDIKSNINTARIMARKMGKMTVSARQSMLDTESTRAEFTHIGIYTISKLIKNLGFKDFYITTNDLKTGLIKSYIEKTKHSV